MAQQTVKHYEMHSSHFARTKGYEYYNGHAEIIADRGVDGMAADFMDLQVWGTPEQCYEKIARIHARTDCCGFLGIFSYSGMPAADAMNNARTFAQEVLPALRKLGSLPAFDVAEEAPPSRRAAG